jgi:hypothetical protein
MEGFLFFLLCIDVRGTVPGVLEQRILLESSHKIPLNIIGRVVPYNTPSRWKFVFKFDDGMTKEVTVRNDSVDWKLWPQGARVKKVVTGCGDDVVSEVPRD